jgi:hypothetical protein
MNAVFDRNDITFGCQDEGKGGENRDSLTLDMPMSVQESLDHILRHYQRSCTKPVFRMSGDPLCVVSGLVSQVKDDLPEHLQEEGRVLLNFMVDEIVSFCRERQTKSLSLHFSFERG